MNQNQLIYQMKKIKQQKQQHTIQQKIKSLTKIQNKKIKKIQYKYYQEI